MAIKMKHRFFRIGERVFNCDYNDTDLMGFGKIVLINGKAQDKVIFDDDEIFFYVQNFDELIGLCDPNNGEDFVIVDYNDLFEEL